jgi:hypothetical protein
VPVPVPVPVLPGAARCRPVPVGAGAADGPQETLYYKIAYFIQNETRLIFIIFVNIFFIVIIR